MLRRAARARTPSLRALPRRALCDEEARRALLRDEEARDAAGDEEATRPRSARHARAVAAAERRAREGGAQPLGRHRPHPWGAPDFGFGVVVSTGVNDAVDDDDPDMLRKKAVVAGSALIADMRLYPKQREVLEELCGPRVVGGTTIKVVSDIHPTAEQNRQRVFQMLDDLLAESHILTLRFYPEHRERMAAFYAGERGPLDLRASLTLAFGRYKRWREAAGEYFAALRDAGRDDVSWEAQEHLAHHDRVSWMTAKVEQIKVIKERRAREAAAAAGARV